MTMNPVENLTPMVARPPVQRESSGSIRQGLERLNTQANEKRHNVARIEASIRELTQELQRCQQQHAEEAQALGQIEHRMGELNEIVVLREENDRLREQLREENE